MVTKQRLWRWAGLLGLVSGGLLALGGVGVLGNLGFAGSAFALAHLLLTLVIIGMYGPQVEQTGWLGLAGFAMMLLGNVLFFSDQVSDLGDAAPFPPSSILTAGVLLFAIANTQAGVLPPWAGWLMFLGLGLNLLGGAVQWPEAINSVAAPILNALGVAWFGLALWTLPPEPDFTDI